MNISSSPDNFPPSLNPVISYIDEQNKLFLESERFRNFRYYQPDPRVHLILYFLRPSGNKIKELDLFALRELSYKGNVLPVIGKADTLTVDERKQFKETASLSSLLMNIIMMAFVSIDFEANDQERCQNISV